MAYPLVQVASGTVNPGTSLAVAFLGNNTAGNFLVYGSVCGGTGTSDAVTDTLNTPATDVGPIANTDAATLLATVTNCNAGANTATVQGNGSASRGLIVAEFAGVDTTTPKDKTTSGTGFGTALSSGATAATTQANELVVGVNGCGNAAAVTVTPGGSFLEVAEVLAGNPLVQLQYRVVAAIAAYTSTATAGGGSNWEALIATYKYTPPPPPEQRVGTAAFTPLRPRHLPL